MSRNRFSNPLPARLKLDRTERELTNAVLDKWYLLTEDAAYKAAITRIQKRLRTNYGAPLVLTEREAGVLLECLYESLPTLHARLGVEMARVGGGKLRGSGR